VIHDVPTTTTTTTTTTTITTTTTTTTTTPPPNLPKALASKGLNFSRNRTYSLTK